MSKKSNLLKQLKNNDSNLSYLSFNCLAERPYNKEAFTEYDFEKLANSLENNDTLLTLDANSKPNSTQVCKKTEETSHSSDSASKVAIPKSLNNPRDRDKERIEFMEVLKRSSKPELDSIDVDQKVGFFSERDAFGITVGEIVTSRLSDTPVLNYLSLVQKNKALLIAILSNLSNSGYHTGHLIAVNQKNPRVLALFFSLVIQYDPNALSWLVLTKIKDDQSNIGHLIARFQTSVALINFIKVMTQNAPEILPELLNAKNRSNKNMLDLIKKHNRGSLGAVIYLLLSSNRLSAENLDFDIKKYKHEVLNHISTLPPSERLNTLNVVLNKNTLLGNYFSINNDPMHTFFCPFTTLSKRVKKMQQIAQFAAAQLTEKQFLQQDENLNPSSLYPMRSGSYFFENDLKMSSVLNYNDGRSDASNSSSVNGMSYV